MTPDNTIQFYDVFANLEATSPSNVEFENDRFRRVHKDIQAAGLDVQAVRDEVGQHGVCHIHLSLAADKPVRVRIPSSTSELGFRVLDSDGARLWLPRKPVGQTFDEHDRIKAEGPIEVNQKSGHAEFTVPSSDETVELPIISIPSHVDHLFDEIMDPDPIERTTVSKRHWFDYDSVESVWRYLVRGRVYDPRTGRTGLRWECQQCAHTLWYYLLFLQAETGKEVYGLLGDMVAFSVLLSLPESGRWRHATWTRGGETHTRFQVDGIHLLVSEFQRSGNQVFLDAAQRATEYLVKLADELDDGLWFLHDTHESTASDYYDMFESTAFGKSKGNTLCLNTHVWTLTALYRVQRISDDASFERSFHAGLQSLKTVLEASPGTQRYELIYGVRDTHLRADSDSRYVRAIQRRIDDFLRSVIRRIKRGHPRLKMPNGFIERDLESTELSDYYHLQNMKDILVLYELSGIDWLYEYIAGSLQYTFHGSLAMHFMNTDAEPDTALDVLALAMAVDDGYEQLFTEYLERFRATRHSWPADVLASPFIQSPVNSDDLQIATR